MVVTEGWWRWRQYWPELRRGVGGNAAPVDDRYGFPGTPGTYYGTILRCFVCRVKVGGGGGGGG